VWTIYTFRRWPVVPRTKREASDVGTRSRPMSAHAPPARRPTSIQLQLQPRPGDRHHRMETQRMPLAHTPRPQPPVRPSPPRTTLTSLRRKSAHRAGRHLRRIHPSPSPPTPSLTSSSPRHCAMRTPTRHGPRARSSVRSVVKTRSNLSTATMKCNLQPHTRHCMR
jgi:hypothetical protein